MLIIKKGSLPLPEPPWWTKMIIACGFCETQFRLEESDKDRITGTYERGHGGVRKVCCACPTCGQGIAYRADTGSSNIVDP